MSKYNFFYKLEKKFLRFLRTALLYLFKVFSKEVLNLSAG